MLICQQSDQVLIYAITIMKFELYSRLKEGMDDISSSNTRPFADSISDIKRRHR